MNVEEATTAVIEVFEKEKPAYEREASALAIKDDTGSNAAMLFIAKCREAEKKLDAERRSQTDPLNYRIETIMKPYKDAIGWFQRLREGMDQRLQEYRRRKALELQQEQQRQLAEKRKAEEEARLALQKEQERLAEQERKLAESNKAPTVADAKAVAKQAEKVEQARAVLADAAAAPVPVVEQQAKTTTLDDGTQVTSRAKKGWVFTCGVPKGTVIDRADQRFSDLPDSLFVLDERRINAMVKAGMREIPGITIVDESVTAVKAAK